MIKSNYIRFNNPPMFCFSWYGICAKLAECISNGRLSALGVEGYGFKSYLSEKCYIR